jgi:hypothetical protein
MPTLAFHVPDDWEFKEVFEKGVQRFDTKKAGPFIKSLVEKQLSKAQPLDNPEPLAPNVIVDLTTRLLGEIDAQEMAKLLEGKDQPRVLRTILTRYLLSQEANPMAAEDPAPYHVTPRPQLPAKDQPA